MNESILIGSHDGHLRCISIEQGKQIWIVNFAAAIFASPQVLEHRFACVCTVDGQVHIVSISTGVLVAESLELPSPVFASAGVDRKNNLYISCRDSHLHQLGLRRI